MAHPASDLPRETTGERIEVHWSSQTDSSQFNQCVSRRSHGKQRGGRKYDHHECGRRERRWRKCNLQGVSERSRHLLRSRMSERHVPQGCYRERRLDDQRRQDHRRAKTTLIALHQRQWFGVTGRRTTGRRSTQVLAKAEGHTVHVCDSEGVGLWPMCRLTNP